jgi:thiamine biosynthesis lipoprotein
MHAVVEHVMGMPVSVDVRDPGVDPDAVIRVFDWLRFVDATFSTYKDDSQISRINRRELRVDEADTTVSEVLLRCQALRLETRGYFDAWAVSPGSVDPSGLVKGWSVDRAARILEQAGARNYAVDAGGDIRLRGGALPEERWRVGVQHPLLRDRVAAVVVANDLAIATSGEYERGKHVVDPHTGCAPEGVLSVTVVGPDLARADAYATAAFAMGAAGPAWTARLEGYEALTILADETVVATRGFPTAQSEPAPLRVA